MTEIVECEYCGEKLMTYENVDIHCDSHYRYCFKKLIHTHERENCKCNICIGAGQ